MGKGKRGNVLSAFIVLAMLPEILGWVAPKFCHDYNCPEFTVVDKNAVSWGGGVIWFELHLAYFWQLCYLLFVFQS